MIHFVGDLNFSDGFFDLGFGIASQIRAGENIFKNVNIPNSHTFIGNLECVVSNISNKKGSHRNQFRIDPSLFNKNNICDIYGTANNHSMQHGEDAYHDTLKNVENSGRIHIGSKNKTSHEFIDNNNNIGISNYSFRHDNFTKNPSYVNMPTFSKIKNELEQLSSCDFKIAYLHWGIEYMLYPSWDQRYLAKYLLDMGYDMIIGSHPHVLQGYEKYKGKYIFYSLGNFLFRMPYKPTKYSCILDLSIEDHVLKEYKLRYVELSDKGFPVEVEECNIPKEFRFENLNSEIDQWHDHERYFTESFNKLKENRYSNYKNFISNIYKYNFYDMASIIGDSILRKLKK